MKKNCGSGASNKIKTRLACILEADESKRLRMGESLPNHDEDHTAGKKRKQFIIALQIGSQDYPSAGSDENSGCRSCSGQGTGKARDNPSLPQ